jgi:hypothetical protein
MYHMGGDDEINNNNNNISTGTGTTKVFKLEMGKLCVRVDYP